MSVLNAEYKRTLISKQVLTVLAKMEEKGSDLPFYLINQNLKQKDTRQTNHRKKKKKLNETKKRPDYSYNSEDAGFCN